MEDECGEIIDMTREDADSVQVKLTKLENYDNNVECVLRIMAPENKRFVIKIDGLDIQWDKNCSADYMQIFDGASINDGIIDGLSGQVCSSVQLQRGYTSTDRFVTIRFHSDAEYHGVGFTILFTAFRTDNEGMCYNTEFQCKASGRCISSRLVCDGYDHCIDDSDECRLSTPVIIGVSVGCVIMVLVIIGMIVCCCVLRRRYRKNDSKKDEPVTDDVSSGAQLYRPTTFRRPVYTVPSMPPEYKYTVNREPAYIQPIYIQQYPEYSAEYQPTHAWLTAPDTDRQYSSWYN